MERLEELSPFHLLAHSYVLTIIIELSNVLLHQEWANDLLLGEFPLSILKLSFKSLGSIICIWEVLFIMKNLVTV